MTATHPLLELRNVTLRYRSDRRIVTAAEGVSWQTWPGDRLVLLGPSGCGKSSIMKAIGGFLKPAEGEILLNGRKISSPGPDRGMVFQEFDQLLPWKTVRENILFPLRRGGTPREEAEERAACCIRTVGLGTFADTYPHALSGGMKQRVAIARCLALDPSIVLMDEPFAALDALTRQRMQEELLELWARKRFTMVFVTHSITEAIILGSRILLFSPHPGRVREELTVDTASLADGAPEFRELHDRVHRILFRDAIDYAI